MNDLLDRCAPIRLVVTDVDGVLTDGGMYYSEKGDEMKKFNVRDGVGVALLKAAGILVGAITGETRGLIGRRMRKMGMDFVCTGVRDKAEALKACLHRLNLSPQQVAYLGDEINDLPLIGQVGVFFSVVDGADEVTRVADYTLRSHGGQGALREAAFVILRGKGAVEETLNSYLCALRSTEGRSESRFEDLREAVNTGCGSHNEQTRKPQ